MNMCACAHQILPEDSGPPVQSTSKDRESPTAVLMPAVIPLHWHKQAKKQLDRDIELGIIKPVDANEPVEWHHSMVVVRKHNGTPKRMGDMQAVHKAMLRHAHSLTSPYPKAMSVPSNVYKTVTDAWEGYEVNWSGFVIGSDSVRPMPHLTNAIRDFPMPVNRTDLISFMVLAQQVSYSTAVAPLLLPFRTLLYKVTLLSCDWWKHGVGFI